MPAPVRCLIVDDNATFSAAATGLLERAGMEVVGVARTAAEALRSYEQLRPDVTLVDVDLGPECGFDVAKALDRAFSPAPSVIMVSTRSEHDLADLVADTPALGFLSKFALSPAAIRDLVNAHG